MNEFLKHLRLKGYKVSGDETIPLGTKFHIKSGIIKTEIGMQHSYWLELSD